ncbi:membrane-associated protein, putative, partial [Bodo saltans]
ANAPFGGALTTAIVYYQPGATTATSLYTTASGSAQVGAAPIITNGTAAGTTVTFGVQVTLAGVVVASANGTFVVTLANLTAAASAVTASLSVITDPNQAVAALGNIGALLGSGSSSATLVTAGVTMLTTTIVVGVQLSSTQALSVATNVATLLSLSANKTDASAQVKTVMIVVLTGASFNLDVASAVGSTIGQMDAEAGGAVAAQMALVICAQVLVGQQASVDLGSAGSMTAASSTGAALAGLAVSDAASGAAVTMPASLLTDLGLSPDATYGAVTLVLLVSPFAAGGNAVLTGGVVRQSITSGTDTVAVTGLSTAIVIKMPSGTTGNKCVYRDEVNNVWLSDGVVAVVTSSGFECHASHLTAFAPSTGSSAAAVALSVLIVALAAVLQLIAA